MVVRARRSLGPLLVALAALGCLRTNPGLSDASVDASGPVALATLPFPVVPRLDAGAPAFQLRVEAGYATGFRGEVSVVFTPSYVLTNIERFGTALSSACAITDDPIQDSNTTLNAGTVTVSTSPAGAQYVKPYSGADGGYFFAEVQIPMGSTLHFSNDGADGGVVPASSFVYPLAVPPTMTLPTPGSVVQRGKQLRIQWTGTSSAAAHLIGVSPATDGGPGPGVGPMVACGVPSGLNDVLVDIPIWLPPGPSEVFLLTLTQSFVTIAGFEQARVMDWSVTSTNITVQ